MTLLFHLSISSFKKNYEIITMWQWEGRVYKNDIDLTTVTIIYLLKFKNTYVLGISVIIHYYGTVQIEMTTDFNGHN